MPETVVRRYRLSIDVDQVEYRKIKMAAVFHDETVRAYVLEAIKERLRDNLEHEGLLAMSAKSDPVLSELWDNGKDSTYDKL